MSLTRLTCPECDTTMRPKVPVLPGKKVKCPKCEHVFAARGEVEEVEEVEELEEEEDLHPRKKPKAKVKASPKPAPVKEAKAPPKEIDDDLVGYGIIKDEEKDDEDKPQINYAPDETIRDLRGPAIMKLRAPATWLTFSGLIGAIGWLAFIVILIIPFAFPIIEDKPKEDPFRNPAKKEEKKAPKKPERPFLEVWRFMDFNAVIGLHPALFWLVMFGFLLLATYSGLIAFGGIKFLNLESRTWGIVSGIMALLPVSPAGLVFTLTMFITWGLRQLELDDGFDIMITGGLGGVLWVASISLGVWTLIAANDADVVTGYEYKAE